MGIRQSLNENKLIAAGLTTVMVAAAVVFVLWYYRPAATSPYATREFFSDDDGTTWFVDDGTKIAPFDHNGKQAVLAKVYKCGNGRMFVGYLEKIDDDIKKKIDASRAAGPGHAGITKADPTGFNGILLKKPHASEWIKSNDPRASEVRKVTSPDGSDFVPAVP